MMKAERCVWRYGARNVKEECKDNFVPQMSTETLLLSVYHQQEKKFVLWGAETRLQKIRESKATRKLSTHVFRTIVF